jgi:hypothetical protein
LQLKSQGISFKPVDIYVLMALIGFSAETSGKRLGLNEFPIEDLWRNALSVAVHVVFKHLMISQKVIKLTAQ